MFISRAIQRHSTQRLLSSTTTRRLFHSTFASSSATTPNEQAPRYPGAVDAKFTNEFYFQNSVRRDGEPHPIFHILDTEGNIVNQQNYDELKKYVCVYLMQMIIILIPYVI
jgi:hypothetical protein